MAQGQVISKERCPVPGCDGAGDNRHVYADGGKFCHACNYVEGTKGSSQLSSNTYTDLVTRGITEETCRFFGCELARFTGEIEKAKYENTWVQVFNYYGSGGALLRSKIRTKDKKMKLLGKKADLPLYGQWKSNCSGRN